MLNKLILIGAAGAAGTLMRYGMEGVVHRALGAGFPWGTLFINVAGCFIAGLAWTLAEGSLAISSTARTIFFIGFLGAFTTFSSFMLETSQLLRDSEWIWAFKNVLLNNIIGFTALFLGRIIANLVIRRLG